MRLFIAVQLCREIKLHLEELQDKIGHARLIPVKDFHLTLKFLGDVQESRLSRITEELSHIKTCPFRLSLSKTGYFPAKGNIRVIWVGCEPKEKIAALQHTVDISMAKTGFSREKRFHPHITLCRVKYTLDKKRFAENISKIKVNSIRCPVEGFDLIKSTLTSNGPVYEVIKSFINKQQTP